MNKKLEARDKQRARRSGSSPAPVKLTTETTPAAAEELNTPSTEAEVQEIQDAIVVEVADTELIDIPVTEVSGAAEGEEPPTLTESAKTDRVFDPDTEASTPEADEEDDSDDEEIVDLTEEVEAPVEAPPAARRKLPSFLRGRGE